MRGACAGGPHKAIMVSYYNIWNSLPYGIRCIGELSKFKTALKTHYFRQAFKESTDAFDDIDLL